MANILVNLTLFSCFLSMVFSQYEVYIPKTTNGHFCAFPMVYKGKTFHDCITAGSDKPWCYTNFEGSSWGVCETKPDYIKNCKLATPNVTAAEVKIILDFHNGVRARMNSKRMRKLVWSSELAMRAQVTAESCKGSHHTFDVCGGRGIGGQNMYVTYDTRVMPDDLNWEKVMNFWSREEKYYDITTNKCADNRMCQHFTQIVWANTGFVGCGKVYCHNKLWKMTETSNSIHYFCNYFAGGNVASQFPYIKTEKPECDFCPRVAQGYTSIKFRCDDKKMCEACIYNPNAEGCRSVDDLKMNILKSNECIDMSTTCEENQHLCPLIGKGTLPTFVEDGVKLCKKTCKLC